MSRKCDKYMRLKPRRSRNQRCLLSSVTSKTWRSFLSHKMSVSKGIDRFLSIGFYIFLVFYNTESNADTRTLIRNYRRPDNAEALMCHRHQYFDMDEGRCADIPGGGRVVHMYHVPQLCGPNNVGPYLLNPRYYYACKKDISILAECPDGQYYDQRLHKCTTMDKSSSSTFMALSEQVTDNRLQLPACEKIGLFAVKNRTDLFFSCESNGFQLFQTVYKCPTGTSFNAESQGCIDKSNPLETAVIKSRVPIESLNLQTSNQFTAQNSRDAYSVSTPIPGAVSETQSNIDTAIPSSILSDKVLPKARTGEQMGELYPTPAWQNAGIVVADASQPKSADAMSLLSQIRAITPSTLTLDPPYTGQVLTGLEDATESPQGARSTEEEMSQNGSAITHTMDQILDHLITELTVFQTHDRKAAAATEDIAQTQNMPKVTTEQTVDLSAKEPSIAQNAGTVDGTRRTVGTLYPADNVAEPPSGTFTWQELLNILSAAAHDIRRSYAATDIQPQQYTTNIQSITIAPTTEYPVTLQPTSSVTPSDDALTNEIANDVTKSLVTDTVAESPEKQN